MLLRRQYKITCLEKELQKLDRIDGERNPLWLLSQEADQSDEREKILQQLEIEVAAYG